jgi:hypothetical protein
VQLSVIEGLAQRPGFRGRGIIARFLYALPQSTVGSRDVNPPPLLAEVRDEYSANLTRILSLPDRDAPAVLRLTAAAVERLNDVAEIIEPALARHGQFGFMADWASKLIGAVTRIAGLLHVADATASAREPWSYPIDAAVINRARDIGRYLLFHAMAAIRTMGADPALSDAEYVLGWVRHKGLRSFTLRDAHRSAQSRFRRATDLRPALDLLADHGYLRAEAQGAPKSGRPSESYEVNPMTFEATS